MVVEGSLENGGRRSRSDSLSLFLYLHKYEVLKWLRKSRDESDVLIPPLSAPLSSMPVAFPYKASFQQMIFLHKHLAININPVGSGATSAHSHVPSVCTVPHIDT